MSKPVNNMSYYDFKNPQFVMDKMKLLRDDSLMDLRYIKDIVNTNTSMFGYEDLPISKMSSELTTAVIEQALTFRCHLCLYNSAVYGINLFYYIPDNNYDIHMKPKTVSIQAFNGVTVATNVPFDDIVLVKDNTMDIPPIVTIREYVKHMEIMETTIDKQMVLLRLPAVFSVPEKNMVGSFNKVIQKVTGNEIEEAIALVDETIAKGFTQYDIKFPVSPIDILEMYKNYKNLTLESIGISGANTQKRERLLVGEVQSQGDFVGTIYDDRKCCRELWVKEANEKFGCNIKLIERYKDRVEEEAELRAKFECNNGVMGSYGNRPDNNNSNATE